MGHSVYGMMTKCAAWFELYCTVHVYVKPECISLSLDVHVSSVSNYWWVISSSPYVHNEKPVIINYRSDHNIYL